MTEEDNSNKPLSLVTSSAWTDLEKKDKRTLKDVLEAGLDDYSEIQLNAEQQQKLSRTLKKMATGSAAFTPMRCAGGSCPMALDCPLVQMKPAGHREHGKAPVNLPCLLEETMIKEAILSYVSDYEVDPNNFTELGICMELAEIEVLSWRLNMALRRPENASLVTDVNIGVDPRTGDRITQLQVSPIFEQKQKLNRRKSQLTKLMVGDRQEKYKKEAALKQKVDDDASSSMASVKKQLQTLQQQVRRAQGKADEIQEAQIVSAGDLIDQLIEEGDNEASEE